MALEEESFQIESPLHSKPELFLHRVKSVQRCFDLFQCVLRRDGDTEAAGAFGHRRRADRRDIHAKSEQFFTHGHGKLRLAENDGQNRALRGGESKSQGCQAPMEHVAVLPETRSALWLCLHDSYGRLRGSGHRRWRCRGINERATGVDEVLYQ